MKKSSTGCLLAHDVFLVKIHIIYPNAAKQGLVCKNVELYQAQSVRHNSPFQGDVLESQEHFLCDKVQFLEA